MEEVCFQDEKFACMTEISIYYPTFSIPKAYQVFKISGYGFGNIYSPIQEDLLSCYSR